MSALFMSATDDESVVSSPMPRMAEMSGVMRISETTRMSFEVPGEDEDDVEDEEEEAVKEERRRRRWKKVSMSPEVMEHLLSHFLGRLPSFISLKKCPHLKDEPV